MYWRFLLMLIIAGTTFFMPVASAHAKPWKLLLGDPLCHAVTPLSATTMPAAFACRGMPVDYQDRSLWLHTDLPPGPLDADGMILLVHQSRFDRLTVHFGYADGQRRSQQVDRGAYGRHWRAGGQIAFIAPQRDVRLRSITLRFDRMTSATLLRARLLGVSEAARTMTIVAGIVGGTLTLLALSTLYNILLAVAVRRQFVAWHAAWAGCVFIWGLLWSQLALLVVPGVAGTLASQLATFLSTLAIACATACAVTALNGDHAPRWAKRLLLALGSAVALVGVVASFETGPRIELESIILTVVTLADLAGVTFAVVRATLRGSKEARDFALAWTPPMFVLAATLILPMGNSLFGGGPQIAVLIASALQTVWLSVAISLRLAVLRAERDAARVEQRRYSELARRDSLTRLLNRRGFTEMASSWLDQHEDGDVPLGLLVIDVDHFKGINDRLGHDIGDKVLQRIAQRLACWEGPTCFAGRLGGEEFTLGCRPVDDARLAIFADEVRSQLGAIDFDDLDASGKRVSVSIGAARAFVGQSFESLYRAADVALYAAKRAGRDCIRIADAGGDEPAGMGSSHQVMAAQ